MDRQKFPVTINLDKIEQSKIWKNEQGERCISANIVENQKTWPNGDKTWGFVAQWWKDSANGECPILGSVRMFKPRDEQAPAQQPKESGSPF